MIKGFMLSRGIETYKGYRNKRTITTIINQTNYTYLTYSYSPPRDFFHIGGLIVLMKNKPSYVSLININRLLSISRGVKC